MGAGRDARPGARPRFAGVRDEASPRMFDAVCSTCGKACEVPFRPDGVKPVYCKDCFGAPKETRANRRGSAAPEGGKSIADLTRQIAAMNEKIDRMLRVIEDGDEPSSR